MDIKKTTRAPLRFDRAMVYWSVLGTLVIELICVVLRFGFGKDSTSATASTIGIMTLGYRIHHGYIGALMIPLGICYCDGPKSWGWWILVIGIALFASDFIHHFLILWPITGTPDFDLVYPSE
ncbi:MAG: hypothetical protein AAF664_16035 [Planctomycetota bacterium]